MDPSLSFSHIILFIGIWIAASFAGLAIRFWRTYPVFSDELSRLSFLKRDFNHGQYGLYPDDIAYGKLVPCMKYDPKRDVLVCTVRVSYGAIEQTFK